MTILKKSEFSQSIVIDLNGPEGNAYCLMGYAQIWSKQLGLNSEEIIEDMMSSNYEHLLEVMEKHFGSFITMLQ